ncbi:hypothetical protein [Streptomyces noursei]|uniref:hypothetical protein n=1 Tax=Streptomyces noursei TaxID=1971 RepID=UPI0023B7D726|nr:hypothetical protein [Streptomyces noursei]
MATPQQGVHDERGSRQSRWTEPDPEAVAAQIEAFRALSNREFGRELAAFIAADDTARSQVTAYAIRSPELVGKARRLLPELMREPEKYLAEVPQEPNNAHRRRLAQFQQRADHEAQLLSRVQAGKIARRGHLMPEPNPRSRARRRLADLHPVQFLELVREEQATDQEQARQRNAERDEARRAAAGQ